MEETRGGVSMLNVAYVSLRKMLKDPTAIILIIVVPMIITVVFGLINSSGVQEFSIGIAVEENNNKFDEIIKNLDEDKSLDITHADEKELRQKLKEGFVKTAIIFKGDQPLLLKSEDDISYNFVKNKLNNIMKKSQIESIIKKDDVATVNYVDKYEPNDTIRKSFTIGFLINFMMYSMIYIVNELMELKTSNILKRCYSAPHKSFELLGGIMLAMFCLIYIQVLCINAVNYIIYKELLFTNILGLLIIIPFIMTVLGIGLLLARLLKNSDQSPILANLIIMPTGIVSGTFMPKGMLPDFLDRFSFIAPQYWVVNALDQLGNGIVYALPSIIVLVLFALCLLLISSYNFSSMLKN